MRVKEFKEEYTRLGDAAQAKILSSFFKTAPGQYGAGDVFLGIKVPVQRATIKKYFDLSLDDLQELLDSPIHEHRLSALLILVRQFEKGDLEKRSAIYDFYLKNLGAGRINNWDLVDLSAPNIVGNYLLNRSKKRLYDLAKSDSLWERRVAIIATFSFIRQEEFNDVLELSACLLDDNHDLIHKAVGWMLREVGKRDESVLRRFLAENAARMPRTMLRYAIEKFSAEDRKSYLKIPRLVN